MSSIAQFDGISFPVPRQWIPIKHSHSAENPSKSNSNPINSPAPTSQSLPTHTITVASYNVLAQSLVRRDWFPYCSKSALKLSSRKRNLLNELIDLRADILFLQEVDLDLYGSFWSIKLNELGYRSIFTGKRTRCKHGLVTAFLNEKFESVEQRELHFEDLAEPFRNNQSSNNGDETSELQTTNDSDRKNEEWEPSSIYAEMRKFNVAQLIVLSLNAPVLNNNELRNPSLPQPHPPQLILSNTHLHWNYLYRFVKLVHCHHLLSKIADLHKKFPSAAVISGGDWNVTPSTTIYAFLTSPNGRLFEREESFKFLTPLSHGKPEKNDWVNTAASSSCDGGDNLSNEEKAFYNLAEDRHVERLKHVEDIMKSAQSLPVLKSVYSSYCASLSEEQHRKNEIELSQSNKLFCDWKYEPPFTTFTQKWVGTLDYLFYQQPISGEKYKISNQQSSNDPNQTINSDQSTTVAESRYTLHPTHLLEIPSQSIVSRYIALPDDNFSSDHLLIAAKFQITPT